MRPQNYQLVAFALRSRWGIFSFFPGSLSFISLPGKSPFHIGSQGCGSPSSVRRPTGGKLQLTTRAKMRLLWGIVGLQETPPTPPPRLRGAALRRGRQSRVAGRSQDHSRTVVAFKGWGSTHQDFGALGPCCAGSGAVLTPQQHLSGDPSCLMPRISGEAFIRGEAGQEEESAYRTLATPKVLSSPRVPLTKKQATFRIKVKHNRGHFHLRRSVLFNWKPPYAFPSTPGVTNGLEYWKIFPTPQTKA